MLLAFIFLPILSALDWVLRLNPPDAIFMILQKVETGLMSIFNYLPLHPGIPYDAMGLALTTYLTVALFGLSYYVVRRFVVILLNR